MSCGASELSEWCGNTSVMSLPETLVFQQLTEQVPGNKDSCAIDLQ